MADITSIPVDQISDANQAALMRLQLWFTGETHRILYEFSQQAGQIVLRFSGDDKTLEEFEANKALQEIQRLWDDAFARGWKPLFEKTRREAASIPFGALALYHYHLVYDKSEAKAAGVPGYPEFPFDPQLEAIVQAANQRIYSDGLRLSARIWRIDQDARQGINRILMDGVNNRESALDLAKKLEQFLGAGKDCPRWTSTRLYRLTKTDIASGDRRGLLTGPECDERGVAYNALRLARNEIQAIHHLANDEVLKNSPWVEKEQIVLSPSHPPIGCVCEEVVVGGENGDGIYPVGTINLPLHVQCLCEKLAVMTPPEEFTDNLRAWLAGEDDTALEAYRRQIGAEKQDLPRIDLLSLLITQAFYAWLFGGTKDITGRIEGQP